MSLVRAPRDEWSRINELQQRLDRLERSSAIQGGTMSAQDANGHVRLKVGQIAPGVWGLQVFDASGNDLVTVDDNGLRSFDSAGRERVRVGHLASGDYGLNVNDPNGNGRELLPTYQSFVELAPGGTVWTTTNGAASPVAPAGGPSVTAYVGASGDALVAVSASMWISAGNGANVGLAIDGTLHGSYPVLQTASLAGVPGSVTFQLTKFPGIAALTPNTTHTFSLLIWSSSGGATASFQGLGLSVQPI